jgi:hypothetical protein
VTSALKGVEGAPFINVPITSVIALRDNARAARAKKLANIYFSFNHHNDSLKANYIKRLLNVKKRNVKFIKLIILV